MDDDTIVLLISYVQSSSCLWDESHTDFKRVSVTRKIWKEIGTKLGITGDEAKLKWQKLKGKFKCLLKKSLEEKEGLESSSNASKWKFYNSLLFLKDGVHLEAAKSTIPETTNKTTTIIKTEQLEESDDDFEIFNFESLVPTFSDKETNDRKSKPGPRSSKRKITTSSENNDKNQEPGDQNVWFAPTLVQKDQQRCKEDHYFWLSLMPYFEVLDPVAKLELRSDIQNLVIASFKKQINKRSRMDNYNS